MPSLGCVYMLRSSPEKLMRVGWRVEVQGRRWLTREAKVKV